MKYRNGCLYSLFVFLYLSVDMASGITKHVICTGLTDQEVRTVVANANAGKSGKDVLPGKTLKPELEWQEEYADPEILATGAKIKVRALKIRVRATSAETRGTGQSAEGLEREMYFSHIYKIPSPTRITFAQSIDDKKSGYKGDGLYRIIGMTKDSRRNPFVKLEPSNEWTLLEDTNLANGQGDIWSFTGKKKNADGKKAEHETRRKLWCKKITDAPGLSDKELLLYALYTKNENENKVIQWMTGILQPAEISLVTKSDTGFDPTFTIRPNMPGAESTLCKKLLFSTVRFGDAKEVFWFDPKTGEASAEGRCPDNHSRPEGKDPEPGDEDVSNTPPVTIHAGDTSPPNNGTKAE